jgi:hypothetical protein
MKFKLFSSMIANQSLKLVALVLFCPLTLLVSAQPMPLSPAAAAGGTGLGAAGMAGGNLGSPIIRATDTPTEATRLTSRAITLDPLKPNDFQQFILQTTGQRLPLFGFQFFENINASQAQAVGAMQTTNAFAPAEGTAVSPDYPLGAGDQLIIRAWGSIDVDVKVTIDRNGQIVIPKVGSVPMAGVKVSQSEAVIKQALAKNYKGFEVNVTLGQMGRNALKAYFAGVGGNGQTTCYSQKLV